MVYGHGGLPVGVRGTRADACVDVRLGRHTGRRPIAFERNDYENVLYNEYNTMWPDGYRVQTVCRVTSREPVPVIINLQR